MDALQELERVLGTRVLRDEGTRREAGGDLSPLRQMAVMRGDPLPLPDAVVRVQDAREVRDVMRLAWRRGLTVVTRGGGSGVVEGGWAGQGSIVLDMRELSRIGPIDPEAGSVWAGAGCLLGALEEALRRRGLTTGHYPQSIDLASLGGLVATRSSGQYSLRYGHIEDMVLGLEVVTAEGDLIALGGEARRSLGPELWPLFAGSEGTLGVITGVRLATWPLPESERFSAFAFEDFDAGLAAMREMVRAGLPLGALRLYDALDALRSFSPLLEGRTPQALLLLSSLGAPEVALAGEAAAARIAGSHGGGPLPAALGDLWLGTRNDVSEWGEYLSQGVLVDTIECGAGWGRLGGAYRAVMQELSGVEGVVASFAHAAHPGPAGAALYFTIGAVPKKGMAPEGLHRAIWQTVLGAAQGAGASVSHHHGVGRVRKDAAWRERHAELPLLLRLRDALDPRGLLNPGALWPS